MAVEYTKLTEGINTDGGSNYNTASITPSANKIVIAYCGHGDDSTPAQPTISGCNLTWTVVKGLGFTTGNDDGRITTWRGISASPTTGAITFTGVASRDGVLWCVYELDGVDTSDPIVQTASSASSTVTLGAFDNVKNATMGAFLGIDQGQTGVLGLGAGFSGDTMGWARRNYGLLEFKSTNDTSVDVTVGSGSDGEGGVAFELRASSDTNKFFNLF